MIIIGIDPGTLVTGYGVLKIENNGYRALDFGCIRPPPKMKLTDRYLIIYDAVDELLIKYEPEVFVVESQYVDKNVQSAIKLGMARGIVLIAAKKRGLSVYEYYPTKAKLAISGTGKASKAQVQRMVQMILKLPALPQPEDAADALALAICHANSLTSRRLLGAEI